MGAGTPMGANWTKGCDCEDEQTQERKFRCEGQTQTYLDVSHKQHRKAFYRTWTNCVYARFGCQLRSGYSGNSASFEGRVNVTRIVVTETSGAMPTPSLLAWVE